MSSNRPSDAKEVISLRTYIIRRIVPYVAALTGITGLTVLLISFGVNRFCIGAGNPETERATYILGGGVCGVLVGLTIGVIVLLLMRMRNAASEPILRLLHEALERMRLGDVKPFRTNYAIAEIRRLAEIFDRLFRLQDERVAELAEILHSLNHSLGSPLFRLLDAAERLEAIGPEAKEIAAIIRETESVIDETVTMTVGIADNYSRINGAPPKPVDIPATVRAAVERHRAAAAEKHITMTLSVPEAPLVLMAHESRIGDIASNLVSNAVKYTPDGGHVTVTATNVPSLSSTTGAVTASIAVSDTGIGIEPQDAERIFRAGYRAEAARSVHGTGFGLALVRSIARSYGGDCTFVPNPTGGTTFTATMKLNKEISK